MLKKEAGLTLRWASLYFIPLIMLTSLVYSEYIQGIALPRDDDSTTEQNYFSLNVEVWELFYRTCNTLRTLLVTG